MRRSRSRVPGPRRRLTRGRRRLWRWLVASLTIGLVVGARWGGVALVVDEPLARPDAILALASHEWDRLPEVARWATQNPEADVVLTVPPSPSPFNCFDCAARGRWLTALGVDPTRIVEIDVVARGTWGEAEALRAHDRPQAYRQVLLVTSAYHTRRTLRVFRHVFRDLGVRFGVVPAWDEAGGPEGWWRRARDLDYVAYEWTANVYYGLRQLRDRLVGG